MVFDSQNIVSKSHLVKRGKNKDGTPKKWADRCGQLLTDIRGAQVVTIPLLSGWLEVEPAEAVGQQQVYAQPTVAQPIAQPAVVQPGQPAAMGPNGVPF